MLYMVLLSLLIGAAVYLVTYGLGTLALNKIYMSPESVAARQAEIYADFSGYVNSRHVSGSDENAVTNWPGNNAYTTILIYRDEDLPQSVNVRPGTSPAYGSSNASRLQYTSEYGRLYPMRFADGVYHISIGDSSQVRELSLLTSYRSSPEITEIFTGLLPREKQIATASVQRPGTAPVKMSCANRGDYLRRLRALLNSAQQEEGLTAVICGNRGSLEKIRELLGDEAPKVIQRNQALPGKGTFLITLDLVKGLEFDGVILPDADAKMYPDNILSRHRLYTAVSRATRRLGILADGELTGLLG